jgi:competence ComEA-like helix-hairpin-helix protein
MEAAAQDATAAPDPTHEAIVPSEESDEFILVGDADTEKDMPIDQELPEVEVPEDDIEPPAWVLEGKSPEEDEYQWLPVDTEQPSEDDTIIKDLEKESDALELLDLNKASMIQLERLPSLGFRSAQAIVSYRDENGPFEDLEGLSQVPGLDEDTVSGLIKEVKVTAPAQDADTQPEAVGMRAPKAVEPVDHFHAQQLAAQVDFASGNIPEALKKYATLIKKGKRLDDVIEDLNQVLLGDMSNEICVDILQTLGDAHMKADHIQDALDAYTKAEELLR